MRAVRYFLFCISLLTLAACITPRWHRVQPGMSKEEVIRFVGEPARRTYDGDFEKGSAETWYYDYKNLQNGQLEPYFIRFRDGRVTALEFDRAR